MLDFDFDAIDFDVDGFSAGSERKRIDNRYCLPKAYRAVNASAVKYDNAEKMAEEIGEKIMAGERVTALLSGNFIFGDFIEAFAVTQNVPIDHLQISTLSLSQENIDSLHNLLVGDYLGKLDVIVSAYFWSHNRHNAPYIYKKLDMDDKFQLAVAGTHTKIALMKIGDKKIVINGSANLRSSRSVEEINIETNADIYDFHFEWQSKIVEQYATIKKEVRASKLFDLITKGVEEKEPWQADQK